MGDQAAPRQRSHGSRRRRRQSPAALRAVAAVVAVGLTVGGCGGGSSTQASETAASEQNAKARADTTPPVIKILSPAPIEYEAGDNVTADYFCMEHGQPAPVCVGPVPDGNFVDMEPGAHSFTVEAEDASGNKAKPVTVEYTVVAPRHPPKR